MRTAIVPPVSRIAAITAPCALCLAACGPVASNEAADNLGSTSQAATTGPTFAVQSAPDEFLLAASAESANDVWAVGTGQAIAPDGIHLVHASVLHFDGAAWTRIPAPVPGDTDASSGVQFTGVAAVSSTDAWLVGEHVAPGQGFLEPIIQHWDGMVWTPVASPQFANGSAVLNAVARTSASDVWAVGTFPGFFIDPLVEHFDGHAWTQVAAPTFAGDAFDMRGISADSPSDVWAVGSESGQDGSPPTLTRVIHFDGKSWQFVSSPNRFPPSGGSDQLNGVVALAPNDVWTVGSVTGNDGSATTLIEHFDGKSWRIVSSPNPTSNCQLSAVTAVSPRDIYAVGFQRSSSSTKPLALHWDGTSWRVVPTPSPGHAPGGGVDDLLFGATSLGNGNVWLVGVGSDPDPLRNPSLVLHTSGG